MLPQKLNRLSRTLFHHSEATLSHSDCPEDGSRFSTTHCLPYNSNYYLIFIWSLAFLEGIAPQMVFY